MDDLFGSSQGTSSKVSLPDSDILFFRDAISTAESNVLFEELHNSVPWQEEKVFVWGKWHTQPRLVSWFGDPGAEYSYSGSILSPRPWSDVLRSIRSVVEKLAASRFNSVLLNLYRSGADRMGWHSDDEPSLGSSPVIASLSLGAPRIFQMKHKGRPELGIRSFELTPGSLLIMSGPTQKHWLHSIRKESRAVDPRINLTFRKIIDQRNGGKR